MSFSLSHGESKAWCSVSRRHNHGFARYSVASCPEHCKSRASCNQAVVSFRDRSMPRMIPVDNIWVTLFPASRTDHQGARGRQQPNKPGTFPVAIAPPTQRHRLSLSAGRLLMAKSRDSWMKRYTSSAPSPLEYQLVCRLLLYQHESQVCRFRNRSR